MTDRDGFPYFIDAVSRRSGLPTEQAAALARAVLQTLAERVTGGAPDDLVAHLPNDVDGYLAGPASDLAGPASDLAGPASDLAGPASDLAGPAPDLVGPDVAGPAPDLVGPDLAGPAPDLAGAVGPVLDPAGSALDPAGVVGPDAGVDGLDTGVGLDVGGAAAAPAPAGAGPAEFLRRVGERAGVDPATARAGTGAVFGTLRSAMTVREFRQLVARLPRDGEGGVAYRP
ncbi:DUF2267 domain-containing protein [Micromonospora sp. NPDC048935]|uniref:DUF2267 domain-containing protein n=1 Tax=Micromonospora sp. NPDC048935 TaxID=3364262 RepID=UPI0037128F49